uniref:Uncharacterized protein n=1 Tax=Zonotrichia albicollis TaxID=44394 RepID=A0A8D2M7G7_ZONAL
PGPPDLFLLSCLPAGCPQISICPGSSCPGLFFPEVNLMTFLASACSKLKQDFFSTAVKSSHVFQIHPSLLLKDLNESVPKVFKLFCTEARTRALTKQCISLHGAVLHQKKPKSEMTTTLQQKTNVCFHPEVYFLTNIPGGKHLLRKKGGKHAFLMLLAVRVRNKGLWLRSILELCNCSGIQKTNASD